MTTGIDHSEGVEALREADDGACAVSRQGLGRDWAGIWQVTGGHWAGMQVLGRQQVTGGHWAGMQVFGGHAGFGQAAGGVDVGPGRIKAEEHDFFIFLTKER